MGSRRATSGERRRSSYGSPRRANTVTADRRQLVGRDNELALVEDCIADVLSGAPRVVLCEGDAGIGKTRLAEEALAVGNALGVLGVWGVADDSAGTPPFWPWIRVLRAIHRRVDVSTVATDRVQAELALLAPELFWRAGVALRTTNADEERFRQFDALAELLRVVADRTALAIVIDDAHWADEASLRALSHVIAGLVDERLLLWINTRGPARIRAASGLDRWVGAPQVRHLVLRRLTEDGVREQLTALVGDGVSADDVRSATATCGGNPFLITEFARTMLDRRAHAGAGAASVRVNAALGARIEQLSEAAAATVRAASVLGEEFDAPVLASMLGATGSSCANSLGEARRAGIIESMAPPGRHRFVHALLRDAVLDGIEPGAVLASHRSAAAALEEHHGTGAGPHVFAIAAHLAAATGEGDSAEAARWLERAGDEAMRQLAYEAAGHLYDDALRLGAGALSDLDRCRLNLSRARAADRHGLVAAGFDAALEAADIARRLARFDLMSEAVLIMEPSGAAGFDVSIRRLCQEVIAALGEQRTPLRAQMLARFAETYIYLPDPEPARLASIEALEVAAECDDNAALAAALRARQVVVADPDGLEERERLMARMTALGGAAGDPWLEMRGRLGAIDAALERGDLSGVAHQITEVKRCALDLGGPLARFRALQAEAVLAQAQGRFDACRSSVAAAFDAMRATDHHEPALMRGAVLSACGRHVGYDDAARLAIGVTTGVDAPGADVIAGPGLIAAVNTSAVLVMLGRIDEAAAVYAALGPPRGWRPPPHVVLIVDALGLETALGLRRLDDVDTLRHRLSRHRTHDVACGIVAAAYYGPVPLWLGRAEAALGNHDAAVHELDEALQRSDASGAQSFAVEGQVELASALIARNRGGDYARAQLLLTTARAAAARLGMSPWLPRIASLCTLVAQQHDEPITPRELQVAALVAAGLTNKQIADRLFLSERTAQNHVQHILDKLVLDTRSQIAVWFERRGGAAAGAGK